MKLCEILKSSHPPLPVRPKYEKSQPFPHPASPLPPPPSPLPPPPSTSYFLWFPYSQSRAQNHYFATSYRYSLYSLPLLISNDHGLESTSNDVMSNDFGIFNTLVTCYSPTETVAKSNNVTVTLCLK
jgi:hypothetical protein